MIAYVIDKPFMDTIIWLNEVFKGRVTICGSVGLLLNGKLTHRKPHDIDCLTDDDWYGRKAYELFSDLDMRTSHSDKFFFQGVMVKVFKIESPYGVTVDVMYRSDRIKYTYRKLLGTDIKVEIPEGAIKAKQDYLEIVSSRSENFEPNPESIAKHSSDISFITTKPKADEQN